MENNTAFEFSCNGIDDSVLNAIGKRQDTFHDTRHDSFTNESLLDGLTTDTSLLNAIGKTSSFTNESLLDADGFSNLDADTISKGATAAIGITTAIASGVQAKKATTAGQLKSELKSVCGRKPLILAKKRKRIRNV